MSTTVYTIYKHNLYLEMLHHVNHMKIYVILKAEKRTTAEMFYDSTMIGDADCLAFIPRLAKWKICYVQSTLFTNQLVQ